MRLKGERERERERERDSIYSYIFTPFLLSFWLTVDAMIKSNELVKSIQQITHVLAITASLAPRITKHNFDARGISFNGKVNSSLSFHSAASGEAPLTVVRGEQTASEPW